MSHAGRFVHVDLSQLNPPPIIEVLDYEDILAGLVADFVARWPDYDVANLESDPAKKVLEVAAYRELLLRARVNDACRGVMIAFAKGADLDHLAALFGVQRLETTTTDPEAGTVTVVEGDPSLRERTQLSIEAYSTAGPYGAYAFYGLSADPRIKDVGVYGPESGLVTPGQVGIYVLSNEDDGFPSDELLDIVEAAFFPSSRRPLTDQVLVRSPTIVEYSVDVELLVGHGPDVSLIEAEARSKIEAYVKSRHSVGAKVSLAGISASAFVGGVQDLTINSPIADVDPGLGGAAFCTGVTITITELELV